MKILLLCHRDLAPPFRRLRPRQIKTKKITKKWDSAPWRTEAYVWQALCRLGHTVDVCGVRSELQPLREKLAQFQPDLVFNLLEEFCDEGLFESFVVDFLESQKIPYTGCDARGLILAKNKLATKRILRARGIAVPGDKKYPQIVKLTHEESSRGIAGPSIVRNKRQLLQRRRLLTKKYAAKVFSEEYIHGRELHVGVLPARQGLLVTPVWETDFGKVRTPILTENLKWNFAQRVRLGVVLKKAGLDKKSKDNIRKLARLSYKALALKGCARVDVRMDQRGQIYILEINPNPDLADGDELALCARSAKISYDQLISRIVNAAYFCHTN